MVLVTFIAFSPIIRAGFINFDDPHYVTGNSFVNTGLTKANIVHAFTEPHSGNWHPLTWISHMLDCQLFGLNPTGHHLINVAIHSLNAVMLFLILTRLTNAFWRSAMVATLFAIHPLHVESVAWISERKDVLSTFFGFIAVWFYVQWVEQKSKGQGMLFHLGSLAAFACSLMSKGMFVTLPFLLLLLDIWPLNRLSRPAVETDSKAISWLGAMREKIGFFILSTLSAVITFQTQQGEGAVRSLNEFPLWFRVENAALSLLTYLRKTVWPSDLAVFYPMPREIHTAHAIIALAIVGAVFALTFRFIKKLPWLFVGWSWFIGMLIPVIGLVQVSEQSMADRYTYVPSIGVFIVLVWGIAEITTRAMKPKPLVISSIIVTCLCAVLTYAQAARWKDSETLFRHALRVTRDNYLIENHLSSELLMQDKGEEAEIHLRRAIELRPNFYHARLNLGTLLAMRGEFAEAKTNLTEAIRLSPDSAEAHYNLGNVEHSLGDGNKAFTAYETALRLDPNDARSHSAIALMLVAGGNMQEAAMHYATAVRLNPADADYHFNLATALVQLNQPGEAEKEYLAALNCRPDFPQAQRALEQLKTGRF